MIANGFNRQFISVLTEDGLNIELLDEDFGYTDRNGNFHAIPKGSKSDGASTPRVIWIDLPPFGKYWKSAVFHDFLYRQSNYPKDLCDHLLLEAMLSDGVPEITAQTIYLGVKASGWKYFDDDRALQSLQKI